MYDTLFWQKNTVNTNINVHCYHFHVRQATHSQIMNNKEKKNVVDIKGLKFGTKYDENIGKI